MSISVHCFALDSLHASLRTLGCTPLTAHCKSLQRCGDLLAPLLTPSLHNTIVRLPGVQRSATAVSTPAKLLSES